MPICLKFITGDCCMLKLGLNFYGYDKAIISDKKAKKIVHYYSLIFAAVIALNELCKHVFIAFHPIFNRFFGKNLIESIVQVKWCIKNNTILLVKATHCKCTLIKIFDYITWGLQCTLWNSRCLWSVLCQLWLGSNLHLLMKVYLTQILGLQFIHIPIPKHKSLLACHIISLDRLL